MLAERGPIGYPLTNSDRAHARERIGLVAMAETFGIVLPVWHYEADDGQLLERAVGEVGLDHVTAPAVTGPSRDFRLDTVEQPYFETPGGWHYPSKVGSVRERRTSRSAAPEWPSQAPRRRHPPGLDVLANLAEHTRRLKVGLVLRVDVRAAARLLDVSLHISQRNAWGQPLPTAGACACHPDTRELLRATLDELNRYNPLGFELLHWLPDEHVDHSLPRPLDWQPAARRLLDICFCSACREIAERGGVDAGQAARAVRVSVGPLVEQESDEVDRNTGFDPVVEAYQAVRAADCADWLSRLADALAPRPCWLVHDIDRTISGTGSKVPRIASVLPTRQIDESRLQALLGQVAADCPVGLCVPVWRPAFSDAPRLVRLVAESTRAGVQHFDFEGLPNAAPQALTWLRQAVRFARRG